MSNIAQKVKSVKPKRRRGGAAMLITSKTRTLARRKPANILDLWLGRRNENTNRAYQTGLSDFANFLGEPNIERAIVAFLRASQAEVNALAMDYRNALRSAGASPATINLRIASLKALLKLARSLGMTAATIELPREKAQTYRDTRGPSIEKIKSILADMERKAYRPGADARAKPLRDIAITRLLFSNGLRCHEIVSLDLEHLEVAANRLSVLGKGRTQRESVTVPTQTMKALRAWLRVRGLTPGPLFCSVSQHGGMRLRQGFSRLHREDIFRMLKPYGVRPHGLRHSAITQALLATGGDLSRCQQFSRHANPIVLIRYRDNLDDAAGKVACLLDNLVG